VRPDDEYHSAFRTNCAMPSEKRDLHVKSQSGLGIGLARPVVGIGVCDGGGEAVAEMEDVVRGAVFAEVGL
jgi:hypothetical protein